MDRIATAWATILNELGYDLEDPHFKDTPDRVAKFFREWHTQGAKLPALRTFPNDGTDEMIATGGLWFYAKCAHHGAPFFGQVSIGYIPGKSLLGLSKFARVVDHFANRFTIQERMTKEIADSLQNALEPVGIGVVVRATHLCMAMRGVKKPGHFTVTSDMRGLLRDDPKARAELLDLVKQ